MQSVRARAAPSALKLKVWRSEASQTFSFRAEGAAKKD
jgi:hypothetical protein